MKSIPTRFEEPAWRTLGRTFPGARAAPYDRGANVADALNALGRAGAVRGPTLPAVTLPR